MIYVLLAITLLQTGFITYLLTRKKEEKKEPTLEEMEKKRREEVERQWQNLFNYSEGIATGVTKR